MPRKPDGRDLRADHAEEIHHERVGATSISAVRLRQRSRQLPPDGRQLRKHLGVTLILARRFSGDKGNDATWFEDSPLNLIEGLESLLTRRRTQFRLRDELAA